MNELNLCLIQTHLHWQDKNANLHHFESIIKHIHQSDLIVLPEMFSTGFSMDAERLWDEPKGQTLEWMCTMAEQAGAAITGSFIVRENNQYFNRLFFVFPNGQFKTYDKRHLFTLAGEEKVFSAGSERLIVEFRGWKIMPLICYDLRFPVWCRNNEDVDLQIFVANWPERRAMPWSALLKARAIENMCYVAGLNRVGEDGNGVAHSGHSAVYDELGNELLQLELSVQDVQSITLNRDQMLQSRKKFSFLNDRDQFEIK